MASGQTQISLLAEPRLNLDEYRKDIRLISPYPDN